MHNQYNKENLVKVETDYKAAKENQSDLESIYQSCQIAVKQKEAEIKRIKDTASGI